MECRFFLWSKTDLLRSKKMSVITPMKQDAQSSPQTPESLRALLHIKIERMSEEQLGMLNRVLLQIEAQELAEKLGQAFETKQAQGKLDRIPELVRQFRSEHRYE